MLTVLFFAALSSQTPPHSHVESAKAWINRLSSEIGRPILIDPKLSSLNLYVESQDHEPLSVLRAIAVACDASVLDDGKEIRVSRTKQDIEAIDRRREAERELWLVRALARSSAIRRESMGKAGIANAYLSRLKSIAQAAAGRLPGMQVDTSASALLPSQILLESLISKLGIRSIASQPVGQVLILENIPCSEAEQLPNCDDLVEIYLNQMAGLPPLTSLRPESLSLIPKQVKSEWDEAGTRPSRLRLVVNPSASGIHVSLEGFDGVSKRVLFAGISAQRPDQVTSARALIALDAAQPPDPATPSLCQLSAPSAQLLQSPMNLKVGDNPAWFLYPETNEPLDVAVSEVAHILAARSRRKTFVMNVSDSAWTIAASSCKDGILHVRVYDQLLDQTRPYETVESASSTVLRPVDPGADDMVRAKRSRLGEYARQAIATGQLTFRDEALFFHQASEEIGPLALRWSNLVKGKLKLQPNVSFEWLRLVGGIDDTSWESLLVGNSMSIERLGLKPEFRQLLLSGETLSIADPRSAHSLYDHPIELFTTESIGSAVLKVTSQQTSIYRLWPEGTAEPGNWTAGVMPIWPKLHPGSVVWTNGLPKIMQDRAQFESEVARIRLRRATKSSIRLSIALPNRGEMRADIDTGITPDPAGIVSYGLLTQPERDAIWANACDVAIKEARAHPLEGGGTVSSPTGGKPPPTF